MPMVAFYTLGCKLNQYETEAMRRQLEEKGFRSVDFHQEADVYVINTCTVTHRSDVRSRQMIRRAARRAGKRLVVVTGCYAQRAPQQLRKIPGVDLVLGNAEKARLLEYVNKQRGPGVFVSRIEGQRDFPEMEVTGFARHTRAFLKIQDGCDGHCTYCVVPMARGRSRSREFSAVAQQVEGFIQAGYRELVLTGVNLGRYLDPQRPEVDLARFCLLPLTPSATRPSALARNSAPGIHRPPGWVWLQSAPRPPVRSTRRSCCPPDYSGQR